MSARLLMSYGNATRGETLIRVLVGPWTPATPNTHNHAGHKQPLRTQTTLSLTLAQGKEGDTANTEPWTPATADNFE